MNALNIKIRLFLIRLIDWTLLLAVVGVGIPSIFYSEHRPIYALGVLVGLALVNRIGSWSLNKVAELQLLLDHAQKDDVLHGR